MASAAPGCFPVGQEVGPCRLPCSSPRPTQQPAAECGVFPATLARSGLRWVRVSAGTTPELESCKETPGAHEPRSMVILGGLANSLQPVGAREVSGPHPWTRAE